MMGKSIGKRKSDIWNFFTIQDNVHATCNFCKQLLSYKSSISNLKQHMQRKHFTITILEETTNEGEQIFTLDSKLQSTSDDTSDPLALPSTSGVRNGQLTTIVPMQEPKIILPIKRRYSQNEEPSSVTEESMAKLVKRKKSHIWNFFTVQSDIQAKCNFCGHILSYKSTITNLKHHFQRKHPTIEISVETDVDEDQQILTTDTKHLSSFSKDNSHISSNVIMQPTMSSAVFQHNNNSKQKEELNNHKITPTVSKKREFCQKTADDKLLELVTHDFQPFSIVEDIGFQEYSHALNPSYILPSKKRLSNTLLLAKFEETQINTKEVIKDAKSVTITTDRWTSYNNDEFIAVTAHFIDNNFHIKSVLLDVILCSTNHTSANLANELRSITSHWDVNDKVVLALSDDAANVKEAISEYLQWQHLICFAHTINLIVKNALVLVDPLLKKVSEIVAHFKRSSVAKNQLEFYQKQNGKEPKKLIQSVATKWNSVYYMLQRFKELRKEIVASLAALGKEDWPVLSNKDFAIIDELIEILAPMESTTQVRSTEKHVTLSLLIIITNGLLDMYTNLLKNRTFSLQCTNVLENILNYGINTYLKNIEENSTLLISTFLDPRFKDIGFMLESSSERAKTLVTDALTTLIDQKNENQIANLPTSNTQIPHHEEEISILSSFRKKASTFFPSGTTTSRASIEIQRYLEEPLLEDTENPLDWWKIHAYNFPYLSELVKLNFGTVATLAPCERVFSKASQMLSDRRKYLSPTKVKQIIFINKNS